MNLLKFNMRKNKMFISYFRVSTGKQEETMQLDNVKLMVEKMGINWNRVD